MTVYLVGAGPGDPTLLTLRGADLLSQADVVVYDRLVDERVLELINKSAEQIDVGKESGSSPFSQDKINELLVERARRHSVVVRLKGGDPFVFGRGGEEALVLALAGVDYEIVPGVSALTAVPAYAGVPLTMRGIASSVVVVTGHDPDDELETGSINWNEIGQSHSTIVILMGAAKRSEIARRLISAGRPKETPVIVIERGTTPRQRSVRSMLSELGSLEVNSPATIVVGDVAGLSLASFESRPLFSWRVIVTRSSRQSPEFVRALASSGAVAIEFPTIEITPPADKGERLREHLRRLTEFEWIVFSSSNAVDAVIGEIADARSFGATRIAAVGSETASRLRRAGIVADLIATQFGATSLLGSFPEPSGTGRVLLPRSAIARNELADGLTERGWLVEAVDAYETVHPLPTSDTRATLVGADAITFSSSSTVTGFVRTAGLELVPPVVVSIGPATTTTARELGIDVSIEAPVHTARGLLDALISYARVHPRPD